MIDNPTLVKKTSPMATEAHPATTAEAALRQHYHQVLQETAFENRAQLRPATLGREAANEVTMLLGYLAQPEPVLAFQRGGQLCQLGFGAKTLLRMGVVTRQFFLAQQLADPTFADALLALEDYHQALFLGYTQARESVIFNEQAQTRDALLNSLTRYTTQMALASGVALAINSLRNLEVLLQTTVQLIRDRFNWFYVGVFLLQVDQQQLTLAASAGGTLGEAETPPTVGNFAVGDASLISQCMGDSKPKIALDLTMPTLDNTLPSWHPLGARSAIASPLMARGKAIGALVCYSQHASAFSDQDATALSLLSDQLANAVENARLFAELQRSEEKYRTILDTIEDGYYEMNLTGQFTFINESACAILGYPQAEILDMDYAQFVAPEHTEQLTRAFERVRLTGKATQGLEYLTLHKDGTTRTVETYISRTPTRPGLAGGFRGILRDITRRKEAEQYLIERQTLERSNQALEQFAYVASHDLQEPLRKIQAFGDRLKTTSATALGPEGMDSLARMMKSAHRMSLLINDLLSLSRVKSQTQPFVPVDLNLVLQEVLADLEGLIERTAGRVTLVGHLPTIAADPLQMRQLLQNLLGNALKFHKPGTPPVITLTSQLVEEQRLPMCQLTITDNGIGFEAKYLDRIFQLFQRLHTSATYEGTGIGLSICRSIVERHYGRLTAQSVKDEGATFIITLPLQAHPDWTAHA